MTFRKLNTLSASTGMLPALVWALAHVPSSDRLSVVAGAVVIVLAVALAHAIVAAVSRRRSGD